MKYYYIVPFLCATIWTYSNPHGAKVKHGSASMHTKGHTLEIHADDKTILQWTDFCIQPGETTQFIQPHKNAWVLNRVDHGNPSALLGNLQANGKVFLINPSGIFVGKEARIETAGFLASTLDALDSDFLQGNSIAFWGSDEGSITNLGTIHSAYGDVILLAHSIANNGTIYAPQGTIALHAAQEILMQLSSNTNTFIRPALSSSGTIEQTGVLEALHVEIEASGNPHALAINHTGTIEASKIVAEGGRILLKAHTGDIICQGTLEAPAGSIVCTTQEKILVEGTISTSAKDEKNAGTILLWGQEELIFTGHVEAESAYGNGGFIEISSPTSLGFAGHVSTKAPHGQVGMLLLDPSDIDIKLNGGINTNMTLFSGTYTATAATGTIDTTILTGNLAGTSITVNTTSPFGLPGIITVVDPIVWSAPTTLTLIADTKIQVNADIINLDATLPPSTNTFTLNAPQVVIGTGAQTLPASVQAHSGSISITAPVTCTLLGGTSATSNVEILSLGSGNIDINAGTFVFTGGSGAVSQPIVSATSGAITFITTNDCNMQGGAGATSSALIQTTTGLINGTVALDLNLEHPLGVNSSGNILSTSGPITLTVSGDLNITGGSLAGNPAKIQTGTAPITINTTGHLLIAGGTSLGSEAAIRTTSGAIALDIKGNIDVIGDLSPASIETTAGGNITMNPLNDGGNTTLTGGGGNNGYARIATLTGGNILITRAPGIYTLQGGAAGIGGNSSALIATGLSSGSGLITLIGDDITLTGGLNPSGTNYAEIRTGASASGPINITANHLVLQAGSTANQHARIQALGSGNINIDATSLTLSGTTNPLATGALANISTASGAITATINQNILLQSGVASGSLANINSGSTLNLTAKGNITFVGNTALSPATMQSTDAMLLIANDNIAMLPDSHIFSASNVTLVVDNAFPTPYLYGPGSFILDTSCTITADALRIFTAKREQNTILSPLNGTPFIPGPLFVDSNQERWGVYYPNAFFGGPGFTLFYKNTRGNIPPNPPQPSPPPFPGDLSFRIFTNLQVYDLFIQWREAFDIISHDAHTPYFIKRRCHYNKCVCPPTK